MTEPTHRRWRYLKRIALAVVLLALFVIALFVGNALWPSWKQPELGVAERTQPSTRPKQLVVMTYNIAKCFAHQGGTSFRSTSEIEECLDVIAAIVKNEKPDLVFLTEINKECGPCPVDQVEGLASRTQMPFWAFAENYSWGLPFYRMRSGNAILSRFPMRALEVQALSGPASFWNPRNQRRVLWVELDLGGSPLLVGALRNDSFNSENNYKQTLEILEHIGDRQALLGGDFNDASDGKSMQRWRESGKFTAEWHCPPTFPADKPDRCIDYLLAPSQWTLTAHRVVQSEQSDHLPVVSIFALNQWPE